MALSTVGATFISWYNRVVLGFGQGEKLTIICQSCEPKVNICKCGSMEMLGKTNKVTV